MPTASKHVRAEQLVPQHCTGWDFCSVMVSWDLDWILLDYWMYIRLDVTYVAKLQWRHCRNHFEQLKSCWTKRAKDAPCPSSRSWIMRRFSAMTWDTPWPLKWPGEPPAQDSRMLIFIGKMARLFSPIATCNQSIGGTWRSRKHVITEKIKLRHLWPGTNRFSTLFSSSWYKHVVVRYHPMIKHGSGKISHS